MSDQRPDVLVVGGGPAGAATSIALARAGCDVVLLEKARFPRDKACAEFYSPGAVAALSRLGALADVEARGAVRPEGMRVSTARAAFTLSYAPARALGLPRPELDQALLNRARAAGARVEENTRVLGCIVHERRVVGVRVERNGTQELRPARVVVGADGIHSAIGRSLGLAPRSSGPRRLGLVARYEGTSGLDGLGRMLVGSGRYCGIAPVGPGQVNVALVVPREERRPGEALDAFFNRALATVPGTGDALAGGRRVTPIRGMAPLSRAVSPVAGPGYLLVGDAAGFLDPFTGEGVFRALRGGELAGAAILDALPRGLDPTPAYLKARQDEFGAKTRLCALVQTFLRSGLLFDYLARNLSARGDVVHRLARALGDLAPADDAVRVRFILSVVRP